MYRRIYEMNLLAFGPNARSVRDRFRWGTSSSSPSGSDQLCIEKGNRQGSPRRFARPCGFFFSMIHLHPGGKGPYNFRPLRICSRCNSAACGYCSSYFRRSHPNASSPSIDNRKRPPAWGSCSVLAVEWSV